MGHGTAGRNLGDYAWFTESDANKIGLFSPLREFDVPTPDADPNGIAASGLGAWFAEREGDKIGHVDRSGNFQEFDVPTPGSGPTGIALDRNGTVVFTESFANKIGRFDPRTGDFEEYDVPTADAAPRDIVYGGDGSMWFTEENTGNIGRVTGNAVEEYAIPFGERRATGITAGPVEAAGAFFTMPDAGTFGFIGGGQAYAPWPADNGGGGGGDGGGGGGSITPPDVRVLALQMLVPWVAVKPGASPRFAYDVSLSGTATYTLTKKHRVLRTVVAPVTAGTRSFGFGRLKRTGSYVVKVTVVATIAGVRHARSGSERVVVRP